MSQENLTSQEAIEKMRQLAEDANVCMFVTELTKLPLSARPMATQQIDDDGHIWFLSNVESHKSWDIQKDNHVQLFYANKNGYEYMSIYGTAELLHDRNKIEELWNPIVKAWFKQGKDDPNICLIKVNPEDAYYWDTKDNKMVSLLKIAMAAITGKDFGDGGVEGRLTVSYQPY